MKKALFKTMMCAAVSGTLLALAGCSSEVDDLFDPVKYEQRYANAYQSVVGDIDPYQTWNTARKTTVRVNMPFVSGYSTVRVYNKSYLLKDCVLYGSGVVQNGVGNINVDLPTDVKTVFVTIKNSEGLFRICDNYYVSDGMVLVQQGQEATTRSADTRVSQGSSRTISGLYHDTEALGYIYNNNGSDYAQKTFAEWQAYYEDLCKKANNGESWDNKGPYETNSIFQISSEQLGWTYNGQSKSYDDWIAYYKKLYEDNTLSESNNNGPYVLSSIFDQELDQLGWTYIDQYGNKTTKTYEDWQAYYEPILANGQIQYGNSGPYQYTKENQQVGWTYNYSSKTYAEWQEYYQGLYDGGTLSESNNNGPYELSSIFDQEIEQIGWTYIDQYGNKTMKTYEDWQAYYEPILANGQIQSGNNGPYEYSVESTEIGWTYNWDSRTYKEWEDYYIGAKSGGWIEYAGGPYDLSKIYNSETGEFDFSDNASKIKNGTTVYYKTEYVIDFNNPTLRTDVTVKVYGNESYTNPHYTNPITKSSGVSEYYQDVYSIDFSKPTLRTDVTVKIYGNESYTNPHYTNPITKSSGVSEYYNDVFVIDFNNPTLRTDVTVTFYGNEYYSNPHYDNPTTKTSGVTAWGEGGYTTDFSNPVVRTAYAEPYYDSEPVSVYDMTNVTSTESAPWKLGWGRDMFGPGSFFEEGISYNSSSKTSLSGYSTASIESGVTLRMKEDGEIKMSLIYGGTIYASKFGYIYYKDGQDPLSQPHYVLVADGSTANNYHFADGTTPNGTNLTNWQAGDQPLNSFGYTTNDVLYGKVFKPVFFGEKHNMAEGTTTFPKDYNIVFFVDNSEHSMTAFAYSVPALNYRLKNSNNWYTHRTSASTRAETRASSDETGVAIAAAWTYNSNVYLGFEDDTDRDLNDLVFELEGAGELVGSPISVPKSDDTSSSDSESGGTEQGGTSDTEQGGSGDTEQGGSGDTEQGGSGDTEQGGTGGTEETGSETLTEEEQNVSSQSWILAFEDLGGQDDFDFNDVVLKVEYASGATTATVTPLAAGGSLPAYVMYKDSYICGGNQEASEIHYMFGQTATDVLVNTYNGDTKRTASPITIEVDSNFSMTNNMGDFSIYVIGQRGWQGGYSVYAPEAGAGPKMLCIDNSAGWKWPTERINIADAYPQFSAWGANSNSGTGWYKEETNRQVEDPYDATKVVWTLWDSTLW